MEKAWEISGLIDELKSKGLDLAEDAAAHAVVAVLDWVEASVKLSENKFDDAALLLLPTVKAEALKLADHIDGKDDDGDGKPAAE